MIVAKQSDLTPAQRAHVRRVLLLVLAYSIVVPPLVWLRATQHISNGLVLVMAIIASLPCLGFIASWGRYMSDERDEYHQSMILRRNAVATNVTMGAAVVWGCLQAFGAMPLIEAYWIALVWVAMQGMFACIEVLTSRRRGAQS